MLFSSVFVNNEKVINNVTSNVAATLVHEMIHANRTVMINNGLNALNIKEKEEEELIKYAQQKAGHDLNQYRMLLSDVLYKPFVKDFKKFIPIKVKLNNDSSYTVIAYNRETKDYNEFANQKFNSKLENGIDEFLHQIGIELNSQNNKHQITSIIYSFINKKDQPQVLVASDYYHPYSDTERLVHGRENLTPKEFLSQLDEKINNIINRLENANGFEEVLSDTLSYIIISTRNNQLLDLNLVTTNIINSSTASVDEKIAAKLIQQLGVDIIKWFLTSAYTDYYNDEFEKKFKERYDDLLLDFNDLYEANMYNDEPDQYSIDDLNEIISEKTGKSR